MEKSGAKYTVLYVSDPVRSVQYPSHQELERFLAESVAGNKSTNNTGCDEVCQFKSSLFEGILVVSFCFCPFFYLQFKNLQFDFFIFFSFN